MTMRFILALFCLISTALAVKNIGHDRIIGGQETTIAQYPFVTSMLYTFHTVWTYHACGGVLLTSQTVLSSAQCYHGDLPSEWSVRAGSNNALTGGSLHQVAELRLHPEFNEWSLEKDIAIVRLSNAVTLGNNVATALVAGDAYRLPTGTTVYGLGYGATEYGSNAASVLQLVDVNIVDHSVCSSRYAQLKETPGFGTWPDVTTNMLCAGLLDVGGKDTCQRDAGGPLVHGGNVIVGLVSWGYRCGDATYPGVYADVAENVAWIVANGSA